VADEAEPAAARVRSCAPSRGWLLSDAAGPLPRTEKPMTAAIIGLVGVLIGAVLGGITSDLLERRKQRASALAAARAIATELRVAYAKLESATLPVQSPGWWVGTPVTTAWQSQLSLIAAKAPGEVIDEAAKAYAQIDSWIAERESAREAGIGQPSAEQHAELKRLLGKLQTAITLLDRFVREPPGKKRREGVRIAIAATTTLAALAVLTMLFLPRADVTAGTVAASVERLEGPNSFAECDRVGSHWNCEVTPLAAPRRSCGASAATSDVAAVRAVALVPTCGARGPPVSETVDKVGSQLIVHAGPSGAERSLIDSLRPTPEPSDNWFLRAWRALWDE
jgi:hypothetical protein